MFDRSLIFPLLRADDTRGRVPSPILINLRIRGPRARSQVKGPVLQAPPPGLVFSRREALGRSTCYGTRMAGRTLTPPDPVELALSGGAGGLK